MIRIVFMLCMFCTLAVNLSYALDPSESPGAKSAVTEVSEKSWQPSKRIRITLDQQYAAFRYRLEMARKAGGIDVYYLIKEGDDVGWFLIARHVLKAYLEKAERNADDKHGPEVLKRMRREVEASEAEIPTPEKIVFGNEPGDSVEETVRQEVIRRERQTLRRTAEGSLSAVLTPADLTPGQDAGAVGGRRVVLRVVNSAAGTFYMDRRAIASGLELLLVDSKGEDVPINAKGRAMRGYRAIEFNVRAAPIMPVYSPRFELNLGEYFELKPGETYTLHCEWTLEIHDEVNTWGALDEVYKHRLALRAKPIQVQMPKKP